MGGQFALHGVKEGRALDVGGGGVPLVQTTVGRGEGVPPSIGSGDGPIGFLEHGGKDKFGSGGLDFRTRRPNITQENGFPILSCADGVLFEVDIDGASQGVGNTQGGGGKVVCACEGVDTALEVAVTRKHGGRHQIGALNGGRDGLGERTGVADACHAPVPSGCESQLVEVGLESRFVEVRSDHARSGRKGRFDVFVDTQPSLASLLCKQPSSQQDIGVGGVCARGDGGNDDGALVDGVFFTLILKLSFGFEFVLCNPKAFEANLFCQALVEVLLHC
eukprot:Lithocolla_globosa_v1_NODE_1144_length_2839_cov_59.750449.p2 type:complete len:277 gc:universal NODE_1144_length_2839_cov_59.750449:825-1655(+)